MNEHRDYKCIKEKRDWSLQWMRLFLRYYGHLSSVQEHKFYYNPVTSGRTQVLL